MHMSMMNIKAAIFFCLAMAFMPGNAFSETSSSTYSDSNQVNAQNVTKPVGSVERFYLGIQGSNFDDGSDDNSVFTWVGRFGININKHFSFEARLASQTDIDEVYPYPNWDKSLAVDRLYGLYGVGHSEITESISLYGLIGYTRVGATVSIYGLGTKSVDDYDLSFGLGLDKAAGNNWSFSLEYVQYLGNSELDLNAAAIGATYYF